MPLGFFKYILGKMRNRIDIAVKVSSKLNKNIRNVCNLKFTAKH